MADPVYGSPVIYQGYTYDVLFTIGDDVVIAEKPPVAHGIGRVIRVAFSQVEPANNQ